MDIIDDLQTFSEGVNKIYGQAIYDYHIDNCVDSPVNNPFPPGSISHILYLKCRIDTVQWHVEDDIRNPEIYPQNALDLKRRIDRLNQERTDKVEVIDNFLFLKYKDISILPAARINSESPAWALDRLSILALKIYHMKIETIREDASGHHKLTCCGKLAVLLEQQRDLLLSINELLQDISGGTKIMKVYRQMKMYNDPTLNPVLYNSTKDLNLQP